VTGQVKNVFEGYLQWGRALSNAEVKKEAIETAQRFMREGEKLRDIIAVADAL
jgi:hypothetical protein